MPILFGFGSFQPLQRLQTWALEHLVSVNCATGDIRWAAVALALRSFTAAWAFAQAQFRG